MEYFDISRCTECTGDIFYCESSGSLYSCQRLSCGIDGDNVDAFRYVNPVSFADMTLNFPSVWTKFVFSTFQKLYGDTE